MQKLNKKEENLEKFLIVKIIKIIKILNEI